MSRYDDNSVQDIYALKANNRTIHNIAYHGSCDVQ